MHEIGYPECPKAFAFRGDAETSFERVQEVLGIGAGRTPQQQSRQPHMGPGVSNGQVRLHLSRVVLRELWRPVGLQFHANQ